MFTSLIHSTAEATGNIHEDEDDSVYYVEDGFLDNK